MNGNIVGNGEVVVVEQDPLPKTLEGAEALFQKGYDALKVDDLVEFVDSSSHALEGDPFNENVSLGKKEKDSSKNVITSSIEGCHVVS